MNKIITLTVCLSLLIGSIVCFVGCGDKRELRRKTYDGFLDAVRYGTLEDVRNFVEKNKVNLYWNLNDVYDDNKKLHQIVEDSRIFGSASDIDKMEYIRFKSFGVVAVYLAVNRGDTEIVRYLYNQDTVKHEFKNGGGIVHYAAEPLLFRAIRTGKIEMVRCLVEEGVKIDITGYIYNNEERDKRDRTAIDVARLEGCDDIAEYLIRKQESKNRR